jgi:hypothetical protein
MKLGEFRRRRAVRWSACMAAMAFGMEARSHTWPDILLTEARTVSAPSLGPAQVVCSAYDATVCADVGPFYQARKSQLAQIGVLAAFNPRWGLRLRYTEGVSAPKATLRPTWRVGVIATQPLAARRSLTTEFYTSIGGHLVHRPCLDAYDRRYFCGTLTAWEDFPAKRVRHHDFGVRVSYRF